MRGDEKGAGAAGGAGGSRREPEGEREGGDFHWLFKNENPLSRGWWEKLYPPKPTYGKPVTYVPLVWATGMGSAQMGSAYFSLF